MGYLLALKLRKRQRNADEALTRRIERRKREIEKLEELRVRLAKEDWGAQEEQRI